MQDNLNALTPKPQILETISLWRASMLGSCYRLQVLAAYGIRIGPADASEARKLAMRSAIHREVQSWLASKYTPIIIEKAYIDEDRRISGHVDAVLLGTKPQKIVEIKGLNPYYYKKIVNGTAKPYWGAQLDFYHKVINQQDPNVHDAIPVSLIVDVLDGNITEMDVELVDYVNIVDVLNACWDADILPPYDLDQCKRECPLQSICTEPVDTISEWVELVKERI